MQLYITNGELMEVLDGIQRVMRDPALGILLGSKVKRFNEQNKHRIDTLTEEFKKLIDKYVLKDARDQPIIVAYQNTHKYQFISEEHEQEFMKESEVLMKKGFNIEV